MSTLNVTIGAVFEGLYKAERVIQRSAIQDSPTEVVTAAKSLHEGLEASIAEALSAARKTALELISLGPLSAEFTEARAVKEALEAFDSFREESIDVPEEIGLALAHFLE